MRSRKGVYVMSTSENDSPRKYGPGVARSSASTRSSASSNPLRFWPSAQPLVSHPIQRLNSARSSLSSSDARARSGVPSAGSRGVSGNVLSSAAAMAAESVIIAPSISITGNMPLGTFAVNDGFLSP